jgi:hypothetical protein
MSIRATITKAANFDVCSGDVLTKNVVIGDDADDIDETLAKIETAALKTGATLRYRGGKSVWRESVPVFNPDGACNGYTWHEDGNRCLHERIEYTLIEGKVSKRVLRRFYRVETA